MFIVVSLAVFLAGVIGLSTDYTQIWAHRQMAQAAADASCQAGAADLYLYYASPSSSTAYGLDYSWIGTPYNCSTNTASSPCRYASLNGYTGSTVAVEFPGSVPGAPSLAGYSIAYPYVSVTVTDPVPLSFTKILSSTGTINVKAKASCGMVTVSSPIPLLILDPSSPGALDRNGGGTIEIIGGPTRSIQVNSTSTTAVTPTGGSGLIDLRQAGPNGTGADFGVFGNQSQLSYVMTGTGKWVSPALPWTDPWATKPDPIPPPSMPGVVMFVAFGTNGCPDPQGCAEFSAGNYVGCTSNGSIPITGGNGCLILGPGTPYSFRVPPWRANQDFAAYSYVQPPHGKNPGDFFFQAQNTGRSGPSPGPSWCQTVGCSQPDGFITWINKGAFEPKPQTAIMDPGLYYVGPEGLQLSSGATVRQSTSIGDGTSGTTFYFSSGPGSGQNRGTINVSSNSGTTSATSACTTGNFPNCIVGYKPDGSIQTFGGVPVASPPMQCPGGSPIPSLVPATVSGNILMGPCSGTYGGADDGTQRGFLFFQNRATTVTAQWSGGGQFMLTGFMYFHSTTPTSPSTLEMAGNSSGNALTLGDIVTDKAAISGASAIKMILNPNVTSPVLRPQLLH